VVSRSVELLRLRGSARRIGEGEGPLAGSCELAVRQKKQRHVVDGTFELVEPDGKVTVVEVVGGAVLGEDERRAPYGKIADEPGVSAIGLRPGPNIDVTLRTAWILDGKDVEVVGKKEGEVVRAFAAGSQPAIEAWQKQQGRDEERQRDTAKKSSSLPWAVIVPVLLVIITIIFAEASLTLQSSGFTLIAPSIAIATAGAAVGVLWDQIKLPKFDEREKKRQGMFVALAVIVGIGVNLTPDNPYGTTIQGIIVLAVGIFGLVRERRMIRLIRLLVQPSTDPVAGKPGVFVGRVGDKSPVQFFSQLIAIGAIHTIRKKKKGDKKVVDTERPGFDTTFHLHLKSGELEVDPKDATWSSEHRNKRETWSVFLPIDARVVAYGTPQRVDGELKLASTGPDTLVIYGVFGDEDPQHSLRRKLVLHKITYGALFMVVALAAALAIHGFAAG
jgi:hypothetical protein